MDKFNPGMLVIRKGIGGDNPFGIGKVLGKKDEFGFIPVEFSNKISNHDCNGLGKIGFCYWCNPDNLEKRGIQFK